MECNEIARALGDARPGSAKGTFAAQTRGQASLRRSPVKWGNPVPSSIVMTDKAELPKKKAPANPGIGRAETTQDTLPATARKRKAGRGGEAPSAHEVSRVVTHAEPAPRGGQGRRSDLVPVPSTALPVERQRQRHTQTLPVHRRISADAHRTRKSNMSAPSSRSLRARRASIPPGPPRTMLQHAWHTVLNSDPLADSDEECPDEHLRLDYNRRMQVITRLRGRPPTPEQEHSQPMPA